MSAAIAEHAGEVGRRIKAPAALMQDAARGLGAWAFRAVGCLPIYYAARVGYDASLPQGEIWASIAACTTVAAALLLLGCEKLFGRRKFAPAFLFLALGVSLAAWCMVIASSNMAAIDGKAKSEHAASERTTGNLTDRRADAVERRNATKAAADGETEQGALAKIEKIKAERSSLWNTSGNCNPAYTSTRAEIKLCGEIAALKAKAAAAKDYAKAVQDIAGIDAELGTKSVVGVSAGQTAGVKLAAVITQVSRIENVNGEEVFEWGRGGILELLSAIGLAVMDVLAWLLFGGADEAEERRAAEKERRRLEAEKAEERRCEAEARFAAEFEVRAKAEAEEKARAERATKRAKTKTREKVDPASVEKWFNGGGVSNVNGNVVLLSVMRENYAAFCRAHGESPITLSREFAAELRKLGVEVRERNKRTEVHGLALSKQASRGGLRVAFSR